MHQEGHIGICLLLYAPAIYLFQYIGTSYIILGPTTLIAISLSTLPDMDLKTKILSHRGFTHTIFFAITIGIIIALSSLAIIKLYHNPIQTEIKIVLTLLGFLTGFIPILSHIAGDLLTPMGVKPFWPIKNTKISIGIFRSSNRPINTIFLILGVATYTSVIWITL